MAGVGDGAVPVLAREQGAKPKLAGTREDCSQPIEIAGAVRGFVQQVQQLPRPGEWRDVLGPEVMHIHIAQVRGGGGDIGRLIMEGTRAPVFHRVQRH